MGYIAVDFDGTLVIYNKWKGPTHVGAPIEPMVERVRMWLEQGREVRILTARAWPIGTLEQLKPENKARVAEATEAIKAVNQWCLDTFGRELPIQCYKCMKMIALFDDRAVQVEPNTGVLIEDKLEDAQATVLNLLNNAIKSGGA